MSTILDIFPKKRPPLPSAFKKIYVHHYTQNRKASYLTTFFSSRMEGWMHKKVASDLTSKKVSTLEIGAGTLNQLHYEKNAGPYDIVEPFTSLYSDSPYRKRVRKVFKDIQDVPKSSYDRITTIATFEHITNLPEVVEATTRLLAKNGTLRVAIPNEGTFLWWLGTQVTGFEFRRRYGLDYQVFMRHEHVNTADEIQAVLEFFYKDVRAEVLGVHPQLGFYRFLECRNPRTKRSSQASLVK